MNKFIILLLLCATLYTAKCQVKAITEDGRQVVLFDNGTWKFDDSSNAAAVQPDTIKTNPEKFFKSSSATFLVKSTRLNAGMYINPAVWVYAPHGDNEVNPEFSFNMKSEEAAAMCLTEKQSIDLENLKDVALINAKKAAVDARIVNAEYRTVNNTRLLCLEMRATLKGIKFVYLGYYFSNENGTVQALTYTTEKYFDANRKKMEEFLNGFVEIKTK